MLPRWISFPAFLFCTGPHSLIENHVCCFLLIFPPQWWWTCPPSHFPPNPVVSVSAEHKQTLLQAAGRLGVTLSSQARQHGFRLEPIFYLLEMLSEVADCHTVKGGFDMLNRPIIFHCPVLYAGQGQTWDVAIANEIRFFWVTCRGGKRMRVNIDWTTMTAPLGWTLKSQS